MSRVEGGPAERDEGLSYRDGTLAPRHRSFVSTSLIAACLSLPIDKHSCAGGEGLNTIASLERERGTGSWAGNLSKKVRNPPCVSVVWVVK